MNVRYSFNFISVIHDNKNATTKLLLPVLTDCDRH